jgi:cell division septal protein FtsQ
MGKLNKKAEILVAQDKNRMLAQQRRIPEYFNRVYNNRIIGALALLPIFLLLAGFFIFVMFKTPSDYSASTEGVVTSRTASSRDSTGKVTGNSRGVATYSVSGQQYEAITGNELFGPKIGTKVSIAYNPNNPHQAKIRPALRQITLLVGLYVLLPILVLFIAIRYFLDRY